ncbi:hypothetical protein P8C59_007869 [Phyllachora maydis]|uniref:RRM domain-containing protein n=1 Tax=Phyllachora maydis TaxID=1825666 RepID=A0AAD9I9A6_9PEZI|nr:hypothetical protein P8C59_007869 [Phyllachora maydis]
MSTRPPSRVVFVGNIPYTKTEEQIVEMFSQVGQVLNFRLVYDKETGRPKGFGFAEFPDPDIAASAVRNLNNVEIDGRKLRVDFSNESGGDDDEGGGSKRGDNQGANGRSHNMTKTANNNNNNNNNNAGAPQQGFGSSLPPLPPGRDLPPGVSATDSISQTLKTLEPGQLLDFIRAMKDMAVNDTERCVELLNGAPQLGYAVFQALLLLGLVSPEVINSVLEPAGAAPPARAPMHVPGQPIPGAAHMAYGGFPGATATPPMAAPYGAMPPSGGFMAPTPVVAPAPAPPAMAPDAEQLVQAVMQLTPDQIDALPPLEREQIRAVRARFGAR